LFKAINSFWLQRILKQTNPAALHSKIYLNQPPPPPLCEREINYFFHELSQFFHLNFWADSAFNFIKTETARNSFSNFQSAVNFFQNTFTKFEIFSNFSCVSFGKK